MKIKKQLKKTLEILVKSIPKDANWCFSDGTATFFYGSKREPTDLDIITDNIGIHKITKALKNFLLEPPERKVKGIFDVYLAKFKVNQYEIEVYSEAFIKIDGKIYPKSLDKEQLKRIRKIKVGGIEIPLISPEDVIFSKALTQRGKEAGKHDINDVKAILKNQKIDWEYLEEIARRAKCYDRIFELLRYLGYGV